MRGIYDKLETPYAIIKYTNDRLYNSDESIIYIIRDKAEYEKITNNITEEQPYTGGTYTTLYKSKD